MDDRKRMSGSSNTNVSDTKKMLQSGKQPKMTMLKEETFSSTRKWSKHEEILILASIIDYETEFELSYGSEIDAFYRYVLGVIRASLTKDELLHKIKHLRNEFLKIRACSNTDDGDLFKLSMLIWGRNEIQPEDVPCVGEENIDVPIAKQERVGIEVDNAEKEKREEDGIDELHACESGEA